VQTLSQLLRRYTRTTAHPARKGRHSTHCIILMFIYQPNQYSDDRVVWYGGESTQLHYEKECVDDNGCPEWRGVAVRPFGNGLPSGMSEMHAELVDYYCYCNTMKYEKKLAMAD